MTRKDSVRAATSSAKDSVRHAAEVVAPYAGTAKDTAVHYAHEARTRLAPKVVEAAHQARSQYDVHLHPRIEHARGALPPQLDAAATRAAVQTRRAARQAADYAGPRLAQARTAAEPMRDEALSRSTAALAALRGRVSAEEVQKLVERRDRRCRTGRVAKRFVLLGLLAGGAYAAWKWWDKQANPDWLVEPPAPTEVADQAPTASADGSATAALDPEVQAKQDREDLAEDTMEERDEQR